MTRHVPYERQVARGGVVEPLPKSARYQGPLADICAGEASARLVELLAYFGFDRAGSLPGPPAGLRGDTIGHVDRDVLAVMRSGIDYLHAMASGRSVGQLKAYASAEDLLAPLTESLFASRRLQVIAEAEAQANTAQIERSETEKRERRAALTQQVYFIGAEGGPVKIGVAKNPIRRLAALQVSYPTKLALLATTGGGFFEERRYHRRFEEHRLQGEWFTRCRPITNEIARLNRVRAA